MAKRRRVAPDADGPPKWLQQETEAVEEPQPRARRELIAVAVPPTANTIYIEDNTFVGIPNPIVVKGARNVKIRRNKME